MNRSIFLIVSAILLILPGCDRGPTSGWGFTLPEGDATRGEALFVSLQ